MAEFRKAPDNQPTSNIELVLRNAKSELQDWEWTLSDAEVSLKRAENMVAKLGQEVLELEWQLEQRKEQEVNGL